jgi:hypothetical protein
LIIPPAGFKKGSTPYTPHMGDSLGLLVLEAMALERPDLFNEMHRVYNMPLLSQEEKVSRIREAFKDDFNLRTPVPIMISSDQHEIQSPRIFPGMRRQRDFIDCDASGEQRGRSRVRTDLFEDFGVAGKPVAARILEALHVRFI